MSGAWEYSLPLIFPSSVPAYEYWILWLVDEWFINTSTHTEQNRENVCFHDFCLTTILLETEQNSGGMGDCQWGAPAASPMASSILNGTSPSMNGWWLFCSDGQTMWGDWFHSEGFWSCYPPQRALQCSTTQGAFLIMHFLCNTVLSYLCLKNLIICRKG